MDDLNHSPAPQGLGRRLLMLAATGVLSLLAAGYFLGLAKGSFRVPLAYHHDSMPVLTWIKATAQTGWWVTNDRLGVPGRMEMQDYPTNPHLHMFVIRLLSWISSDPGVLLNLYYLLTFPLTA